MSQIPRLYRRFMPQLLHIIALPLFFFVFVLIYRPFGILNFMGTEWFGVHVTIISCIILASAAIMRLLYYFLPLRLNYTLYLFWCICEIIFMSFFVTLYLWLVFDKPAPYFDMLAQSFLYVFFTLVFPYAILALSMRVYEYANAQSEPADSMKRIRFYDVNHNLKFVIQPATVLYIAAEENYVNIFYVDNGKVKTYVLRASMKSIEDPCLSNGLVRCHRSYYINPFHVKVLRKDREGIVYAVLDADDVMDIPVSKTFYNNLSAML